MRHDVMREYVQSWTGDKYSTWREFHNVNKSFLPGGKPIAPIGSLLSANLERLLKMIQSRYNGTPQITDVLLYLFDKTRTEPIKKLVPSNFRLVIIDYSSGKFGNFICM